MNDEMTSIQIAFIYKDNKLFVCGNPCKQVDAECVNKWHQPIYESNSTRKQALHKSAPSHYPSLICFLGLILRNGDKNRGVMDEDGATTTERHYHHGWCLQLIWERVEVEGSWSLPQNKPDLAKWLRASMWMGGQNGIKPEKETNMQQIATHPLTLCSFLLGKHNTKAKNSFPATSPFVARFCSKFTPSFGLLASYPRAWKFALV